jgi:TPR repeat protein
MTDIARMYEGGLGVAKNAEEARRWYEKAAAAGDVDARAWLLAHPKVQLR